jgi:hypothetical protein
MLRSSHAVRHALAATALVVTALVLPGTSAAQEKGHPRPAHQEGAVHKGPIGIPESMRAEHAEIHAQLKSATMAAGGVGAAARELAAVLHPHFVREEQIALPPLGLLAPLARGEYTEAMRAVLPMTDSLRAELPRMLKEHEAIRAATLRLGEVARAAGNDAVAELAEKLALHARGEEEMFYPAAVLVGELVRARGSARRAP